MLKQTVWLFSCCLLLFHGPSATYAQSSGTTIPRLLLHFDVNGTLILGDTSKKVHDEDAIISAIAAHTVASWNESPPMSFKQYVFTHLLPGDRSNVHLKQQRQERVRKFIDWLREDGHPSLPSVENVYNTIKEKFGDQEMEKINVTVFPSFYVMLNKLRAYHIPFTILLRTFGKDLDEVVQEIEAHPCGVKFSHQARFDGPKLILDDKTTVEKAEQIFELILQAGGHFAIQDDWSYWNRNQEQGEYGKRFIYDHSGISRGVRNVSLFFDDNITGNKQDIVHPCEVSGKNIPKDALYNRYLFPVDTVEAMLDDNYFINRVMQAIQMIETDGLEPISS